MSPLRPDSSLILFDEAHCARPFLQTLQAVRRFRVWAHAPLGRSFCPVVMSATPSPGSTDVFTDRSDGEKGTRKRNAGSGCAHWFCERYGFVPFPSEPRRLFLPLRTFEQLGLSGASGSSGSR